MKNLRSILAALFLSASSLLPMKAFSEQEQFFDKTYPVEMTYEYGEKVREDIKVQASLDAEANTILLSVYTQDYNRRNWIGNEKIALPVPKRHTSINHNFSRIFVLGPQRVKIDELEQRVYTVPQYRWSQKLEPYEESETAQLMVETGETLVDKFFSAIPLLDKVYEKFVKDAKEKEEERYDQIFEKIEKDYVRKRVPSYIPRDLLGETETAREYTIKFDTGTLQEEIPVYLWLRIALGDPSDARYGSPPNKYGQLENILIQFKLNKDKVRREQLYVFFFHEDELKHLNIAETNIEGTEANPAVITVKSMRYNQRLPYEKDKIIRIGKGEYILEEMGSHSEEKDVELEIRQFETSKDRENFFNEKRITYPSFFRGSIFSFISRPTIEEVLDPLEKFSEEQLSAYWDFILNYTNRTGMKVLLSENENENQELLKAIKEYQMNSAQN